MEVNTPSGVYLGYIAFCNENLDRTQLNDAEIGNSTVIRSTSASAATASMRNNSKMLGCKLRMNDEFTRREAVGVE